MRLQHWPAAVSAAVAIVVYAVTLAGVYVYDDVAVVRDDPRVRHVGQWSRLWTSAYFPVGVDNLYRPLVSSSYAIEWFLHGDRPWAFHLVNVLLHAAASAAVARLARGLGSSLVSSTLAGAWFAAMPVHVEAVANLVGRAELACSLFSIGSLICVIDRRYVLTWASGFAAVLCKEQAIVLPLLWWLLDRRLSKEPRTEGTPGVSGWMPPAHTLGENPPAPSGRRTWFTVLVCWTWAAYLVVREHYLKFDWDRSFLDYAMQPMVRTTGVDRWLMPVALLGRYASLVVLPRHLSPDYGGDVIGSSVHGSDPYLWIGLAVAVAWVIAVIRCDRPTRFCLVAAAATYGLVGNVVAIIGVNFAERLVYLPTAFLAIAVTGRVRARVFPGLLIVIYAVQSAAQARMWNHPRGLFADAAGHHPGSIQLYLLLAQEDRASRDYAAADADYASLCDRHPSYDRAWLLRAENALDGGNLPLARRCLEHTRSLGPVSDVAAAYQRLSAAESTTRRGTDPRSR